MTAHEAVHHHHQTRDHPSMFTLGMKMPVAIFISFFLLAAIWYVVPSTLSPTRLSTAQLEAFLSSPVIMEAHRPGNAPPQPSLSLTMNVSQEEVQESVSALSNNISASEEHFKFKENKLLPGDSQSPASSEILNSSSDEDSDANSVDPEPLSPIASRSTNSGGSNYDYGQSPAWRSDTPTSNSSVTLEDPTTEDDDLEVHKIAPGAAQYPLYNGTSPSPDLSLQLSAPTPLEVFPGPEPEQKEGGRYMFPMLSNFVGTGNQLMEYKSIAVIARTLNRTLCLVPFFGGPQRHFGYLGSNHYGLHIEDRYDLKELSRFVKLVNVDECIQQCNGTLDRVWRLRSTRSSDWSWWFPRMPAEVFNLDRQYGKWSSPAHIAHILGHLNEEPEANCVGMGGAFPGLRWRGGMWAATAYMVHGSSIMNASDVFQARALGTNAYISVHWRFEESNCEGHSLGLCFTRCAGGGIIGGGLQSPRYMELPTVMGNFRSRAGFHGAGLTKEDLAAAIYDKAVEQGVASVYLSTDGWLRGNESRANVRWVVEDIRRRGLSVSGLWEIEGLPNFADGAFVVAKEMPKLFGIAPGQKVSNHMIALVEQEICGRSVVFLGSGQSSWSLAVFDARRSHRRRLELEESERSNHTGSPLLQQEVDDAVIEHLYEDKHAAGPACNGIPGGTPETYEDEAPDGWLDYEACERRIDLGGKCVRLVSEITK